MKGIRADAIFKIEDNSTFREKAFEIFNYQVENNSIYRQFINSLGIAPANVSLLNEIPFLPVGIFKNHKVITGVAPVETVFESSGTTGSSLSRHYLVDTSLYERSFLKAFNFFYGDPADYLITALLPSYTERKNSSLVHMMDHLIRKSVHSESGFYGDNYQELISVIKHAGSSKRKAFLMGVSFALLDLAEKYSPDLSGVIVMETGGMKGRRKELTREELHSILKNKLNVTSVHSEYGMTELLSQAYSKGDGLFMCPPWMRILIRDPQDPLTVISEPGITGGINIIDLANIHSCSFIATGDLGRIHPDGSFEVLGRLDDQDIRGCNLLAV
jgi:phenylacetate-coenzyme A ligase PaaK-like adenylate-forming protein